MATNERIEETTVRAELRRMAAREHDPLAELFAEVYRRRYGEEPPS